MESAAHRRFRTVFLSFDGRLLELPNLPTPCLVYDVAARQAHRTIARERELVCGSGRIELKLDVHAKHDGVVVGLIRQPTKVDRLNFHLIVDRISVAQVKRNFVAAVFA